MKARPGLLALAWLAAVNCRAPLFAVGPALSLIVADLGLSFTVAGLLPSLPLLFMGLLGLPGGLLVDRFGPARLLGLGLALVALTGLVRAAAPSTVTLLLATMCLGGAIGIVQPALPRIARDALPGRIALATAIYSNGLVVGGFIGAALAIPILSLVGPLTWRGLFAVWGVVGLVAALGWVAPSLAERRDQRQAVDWARPEPAEPAPHWLRRALLDPLATPGMPAIAVAFSTQSAIYYAFSAWLPTYLLARGWPLANTAAPAAGLALVGIPAGLLVTPFVDVVGRRPLLAMAGCLTVIASIGLLLLPDGAWVWAILAGIATTCALQVCLTGPPELAPPDRVGATAGAMLTVGYVGAVLGPFAVGALRDLSGDYVMGFLVLAGIGLALTVAGLRSPASPTRAVLSRAESDREIGAARSP